MKEELALLESAAFEIKFLKQSNQLMAARLEMFDSMMSLLHTSPANRSQGMSPDLAYEIEKFIRLNDKQQKTPETN